ncbi:MAG: polyketide cyclase [Akkermansiaceae bacterium]|nr:polyketide cyclase [Akkermansiaceae bacterium]
MATDHPLEIVNTRVFSYPPDAVFAAFSDPEKLATWWGPEGFTSTFSEFDFRVGGEWVFVLHGPDGTDYPNHSRFTGVAPQRSIVLEHLSSGHEFTMTMLYEDLGGRTRLTWQMVLPKEKEELRGFITQANEQNFDRLEACLKRSS